MNKYLQKIAGLTGSFAAAAKSESLQSLKLPKINVKDSGLSEGPTVSGKKPSLNTTIRPRRLGVDGA